MRRAHQGKLGAETWILFLLAPAFCLAFCVFLLFGNRVHRPSRDGQQMAQFNALNAATELFAIEFDGYPPSDANDPAGRPYCGSMKLTEALMGQDLFGFHTKSTFRRDGLDAEGTLLYPANIDDLPIALRESSMRTRKGPFLQAENANAYRLVDIYGEGNTGPFPEDTFVLCDTYAQRRPSDQKTGMPILYYRADSAGTTHDVHNPDNRRNIYHYQDNHALVSLGVPGKPGETHPLANPKRFYLNTQSCEIPSKPYRVGTFILISAGLDGLYGTADDICNFEWEYRKR